MDNFNRVGPALGATWSQPMLVAPTPATITSERAVGVAEQTGIQIWNTAPQPLNDVYACVKSKWQQSDPTSQIGACVAIPPQVQDVACCYLNEGWIALYISDDHGPLTEVMRATVTSATGDFVGIRRSGVHTLQCFSSTTGKAWTAAGTEQTITTMADGGAPGFIFVNANKSADQWEGGQGPLPTDHVCGVAAVVQAPVAVPPPTTESPSTTTTPTTAPPPTTAPN
jgi:hypothetical protein